MRAFFVPEEMCRIYNPYHSSSLKDEREWSEFRLYEFGIRRID